VLHYTPLPSSTGLLPQRLCLVIPKQEERVNTAAGTACYQHCLLQWPSSVQSTDASFLSKTSERRYVSKKIFVAGSDFVATKLIDRATKFLCDKPN
jgi:hypothetical protein